MDLDQNVPSVAPLTEDSIYTLWPGVQATEACGADDNGVFFYFKVVNAK